MFQPPRTFIFPFRAFLLLLVTVAQCYAQAPMIGSVSPPSGSTAGGTPVTINGSNFTGATSVTFGGTAATSFTVINPSQINVTTPARAAGTVTVSVTTPGGTANWASPGFTYTAPPLPTITSVSPSSGSTNGGTVVTINGSNLTGATVVSFGGTSATTFNVVSPNQISATTPAHSAGVVTVSVTTPGGTANWTSPGFNYIVPAPTVTSVSPATGSTNGGTSVTITGADFTGATSVTFGGAAATGVTVVDATTITAATPARPIGPVAVAVTTPGGSNNKPNAYTYVALAPTISSISPGSGSTNGGTSVTITGTDFTGATSVTFGGSAATGVTVVNNTTITATTPAHAEDTVTVSVTTPNGTANWTSPGFSYVTPAPTVTDVSPVSGSTNGGTSVTITGTDFTGATSVKFGALDATGVTVVNGTTITATTPAQDAGSVTVAVITPAGIGSKENAYTYVALAPTISAVSPGSGSTNGGTSVTITGTDFTGATSVTFGGSAATGVTVVNNTTITATTPAHAEDTVAVSVTTPNGTANWTTPGFSYVTPAPTVTDVSPVSGSTNGGTSVTITGTDFTGATSVKFGALDATGVTVVNGTTITATTPAQAAGSVAVAVITPAGTGSKENAYTYVALAPTVSAVSPGSGSTNGGTSVTITGTDFTGATSVTFGGVSATGVSVVNNTTITAITPAGAVGAVDVAVTNNTGTGTGTSLFTYNAVAPTVVSPTSASITSTAATLGGNVSSDGGSAVTERGIVYASTAVNNDPLIGGTGVVKVTASGTTGVFTAPVTGLIEATGYTYKAYAINSIGTTYTGVATFSTLSANANLSGLTLSVGTLSPAFHSGTLAYTSVASHADSSLTVTPTLADTNATVKVNGNSVASGTASGAILLNGGANTITTVVTAQDGTQKTYTVTVNRDSILAATFNSASDVPLSVGNYNATGNTVNLALTFAPAAGTQLMVVKNTGIGFITGNFSNLAQGQEVVLTYNGASYSFIANYYGGTGNDLVLVSKGSRAYSWGSNANGQLGNNSTTQSTVPVAVTSSGVLSGKTLLMMAKGESHTVALCSDGALAAWGLNASGQLGDNTTNQSTVPVAVDRSGVLAGKTVVAVAAGTGHSLALCSDGTVAAWGLNSSGQLGNNSTTNSSVPVAVTSAGVLSGKTVVALASGGYHSLALCSDGTLAAWGRNDSGGLGNNGTAHSSVPVAVDNSDVLASKTVVAVAAGYLHSVALCSDGTVAAWGRNNRGQLGNNSTTNSPVPVVVTSSGALSGKTVVAVAAGDSHNLALCSDGSVAAWGYNVYGQLGNNSNTDSPVPVAVTSSGVLSGKTIMAVAPGRYHNVALCTDGTLAAWGRNTFGSLGNNSTTTSWVPVAVTSSTLPSGSLFTGIFSGSQSDHSLALVTPSNNADLSGLAVSEGTLSPSFSAAGTSYTISVATAINSITVTPTTADALASVKVNNETVSSGSASNAIALNPGDNTIQIVVNAQDTLTTKTYTVTVNRAYEPTNLSALTLGSGTLSPAFASTVLYYTVNLPDSTTGLTVAPTTSDPGASVTVNGNAVTSGSASSPISLNNGINTISVVVTKAGSGSKTYTIVVLRAFPPRPVVETLAASGVANDSATLHGTVNPSSSTTDGSFVYSTSPTLQPEVSTLALMVEPVYVTADSLGNVYVSEGTKIRKITPQGTSSTLAGSDTSGILDGTGAEAQFGWIYGITSDGSNNLYVEDSNHTLIRKITPAGVVTTLPSITPYTATGLAADSEGNLYFMDGPCIVRRSINGTFHVLAGSTTAGFVDGTGSAARFGSAEALAVDRLGNVYMVDYFYHAIRKITPDGVVTTLAGNGDGGYVDGTGSAARFNLPVDLSVDANGNVYVLDKSNRRIRKVSPEGVVTTIAGSGVAGSANGTGTSASFSASFGLAGMANGDLYLADTGNYKIRSIRSQRLEAQTGLVGNTTQNISTGLTGLSEGVTYYYRAEAVNTGGTSYGAILSFTPHTPTVAETWLAAHFTAAELLDSQISGWSASPDGDGLNNLAEFAFGSDPKSAASGLGGVTYSAGAITRRGQPVPRASGADFHADFCRRKDHVAAGLTYTIQFSANLTAWENSATEPTVVASDSEIDVVTVPYPALLGSGLKPRFFRVIVSLP